MTGRSGPTAARFRDRREAGERLARALADHLGAASPGGARPIVLGLPRGGVPVAAPVARALGADLDVYLVRKLGTPGHPELGFGAIAGDGGRVLNEGLVRRLGLTSEQVDAVTAAERAELGRRAARYRGDRPPPALAGRLVVLVDDGLATGATMRAAAIAVRRQQPARLVLAAPVGAPESVAALADVADDVVVPLTPVGFTAVGSWYDDFTPTRDEEVGALLAEVAGPPSDDGGG